MNFFYIYIHPVGLRTLSNLLCGLAISNTCTEEAVQSAYGLDKSINRCQYGTDMSA